MVTPLSAPLKVSIDLTSRCNLNCLHCRNRTGDRDDRQLDSRTLTAIMDDVASMRVFRLAFSGGEPLLCETLPEMIERAIARGVPRVFVSTNGTLLSQRWLDRLRPLREHVTLKISLDGPADVHDGVRGKPGTSAAAVGAIRLAAACGFEVQVTTTLMKANVDFLEETLRLVDRLPCSRHYVVEVAPQGAADATTVLSPRQRQAASSVLAARRTARLIAKIGFSRGCPGFECCAGVRECGVLSDGRVVGCRLLPQIHEGYVQETPLSRLWASPQAFAYFRRNLTSRLADPCITCPDLSICRGGCRAFAAWRSGEQEGPDLRCPRVWRGPWADGTGNYHACGEIVMLGNVVKNAGDRSMSAVVSLLARMGMRPATCHVCEVLSAAASATALYLHAPPLAVAFFIVHGFFDYLDGALRRKDPSLTTDDAAHAERNHALADKSSEVAIFLGIALGQYAAWWLAAAALAASIAATCTGFVMLGAAGVPRSRTVFDRTDRVLLLLAFLLLDRTPILLCLIVVMDCTTIVQRLTISLGRKATVPQPGVKGI